MESLSWTFPVGSKCNHKCPYKRVAKGDLIETERRGHTPTHEGEGDMKVEARIQMMQSQGKKGQRATEAGIVKEQGTILP